jgi:pentatricopeptide repeat domain-containing protein 3
VDKAFELFDDLRRRNVKLNVATYNALLSVAFQRGERSEDRWQQCQELLRDMALCDIEPNIDTFNSVLFTLSRIGRYRGARDWVMQTINEMRRCNIEPTLTSWVYGMYVHYNTEESQSRFLNSVGEYLNGKELTVRDPTDFDFFSSAMVKNFVNLKDLDLAYKLDALLNVGNNRVLLGDSFREAVYYTHFLRLLCMFEQIDTIMLHYSRFVPHLYTPTFGTLRDLLTAVELNEGYSYLPRIWSDLVLFQYVRRVDLVEQLLSIMSRQKQDAQMQELYVKVVNGVLLQYEADAQNKNISNPLTLTGRMLGDMIQILLYADNTSQAWSVNFVFSGSHWDGG